jgi:hypothetical protein
MIQSISLSPFTHKYIGPRRPHFILSGALGQKPKLDRYFTAVYSIFC